MRGGRAAPSWSTTRASPPTTSAWRTSPQLVEELESALAARGTDEWVAALVEGGVPCGPIHDYAEVFADPHTQAREMEVTLEHPVEGTIRALGIPVKLSDTPGAIRRPAPLLGQHTEEILREAGFARRRDRGADVSEVARGAPRPGDVGDVQPPRGAQRDDLRDVRVAVRGVRDASTPTTTSACMVLRGAGEKAFVAGTDIRQFADFDESGEDALAYEATIDRIVGRLETVGKPTVALVDGFAMGCGLALSADLRPARLHARPRSSASRSRAPSATACRWRTTRAWRRCSARRG